MVQPKLITSHKFRVQRAKEYLPKNWPEKVSIFDREAFIEFFLLEDIVRLYEYRIDVEKKRKYSSEVGEKVRARNLERFNATLKIFQTAIDISMGQMTSGNYKAVWKSINEGALMRAAGSAKNLSVMKTLAVKLITDLYDEATKATGIINDLDEEIENIDAHDANVRSVKGLPSREEIDAMISEVERVIADDPIVNENQNSKPNLI